MQKLYEYNTRKINYKIHYYIPIYLYYLCKGVKKIIIYKTCNFFCCDLVTV